MREVEEVKADQTKNGKRGRTHARVTQAPASAREATPVTVAGPPAGPYVC